MHSSSGDKGLPGFDTPTDVKCYSMIDGTRQDEVIRVGESWRTYINEQSIANQIRMTGFCMMDKMEIVTNGSPVT